MLRIGAKSSKYSEYVLPFVFLHLPSLPDLQESPLHEMVIYIVFPAIFDTKVVLSMVW